MKKYFRTYKKGEVVYVDFGWKPNGVQGFIRPAVVVSANSSNHSSAPQITVCPLSTKLKNISVHVKVMPLDVNGLHLRKISDVLPEDIQTVPKTSIIGHVGHITVASGVMEQIDKALITQLDLWGIVKRLSQKGGGLYETS